MGIFLCRSQIPLPLYRFNSITHVEVKTSIGKKSIDPPLNALPVEKPQPDSYYTML